MEINSFEYLNNFKNLLEEGLISEEEFKAKKKEILNKEAELAQSVDKSPSVATPGQIVLIVSGALFVLFALFALGGTGFWTSFFLNGFDTGSLVCIAIAAVGSLELCIGLKGALDARSDRLKEDTGIQD